MSIKTLKNGPQKLLIIGPDPFISQSSPDHSSQPRTDFSYYEISGPDICSLICELDSADRLILVLCLIPYYLAYIVFENHFRQVFTCHYHLIYSTFHFLTIMSCLWLFIKYGQTITWHSAISYCYMDSVLGFLQINWFTYL